MKYNVLTGSRVLPSAVRQLPIPVLDNAPYHSVKAEKIPTTNSKKAEILDWLISKGQILERPMKRVELLKIVGEIKRKYSSYIIDDIAKAAGHTVLRLPPYHCEFNPIELAWAMVKKYVKTNNTTYKLDDVRQLLNTAVERVTKENWENFIRHVIEEDKIMKVDDIMDEIIDQLEPCVLTISNETSSDDSDLYLASGYTFIDLHFSYRIGISTESKIVEEVYTAIWCLMREDFIPTPTKEIWELIASEFENRANFPNCIGAVDGKHIRLTCLLNSGSMYFNYKGYNSIVLMVVADSKYRFVYTDVGSYGKDCDSSVFKRSSLWKSIENNEQQLPEAKSLPGIDSPKLPYFFIGDEAFGETHLTVDKRIFNYRLSRARRFVECSFGILTNK
ncbi:hypothetical protein QTP88_021251 [Uroleucon formosanum]